ncbi:uncharacterized protein B0T15DRAFT_495800 [Chaetomium strumarium]|uniref:Uncharacterized protein n=1 Tax=Chaetomium strumarium TaxID=1170767 RepID=A0AAJ0GNX0_9PEZI|nr:hypothetical protein B0T15DRAFT_495800 [Chaetomium strumarium]
MRGRGRCAAEATAHDGLFCKFHAKQCFGLYMGYKRRNAELDALAATAPAFLRKSKASLASQTFEQLTSETEVSEVHEYLFKQYVLLGKVIAARKIHHKHFYSLEMDYGHKAYLDKLDVYEDDRARYLDLIRYFLWMAAPASESDVAEPGSSPAPAGASSEPQDKAGGSGEQDAAEGGGDETPSGQTKKQRKRGCKKKKNRAEEGTTAEGVEEDYSHIDRPMLMLVGTVQNPEETATRTAPVKEDDAAQLIAEITEIKMLLLCRQIMSHSALLPAALRANSVDEFLSDPSIADSDLRDLCLKVEQPSLQALRDACADFVRGDEAESEDGGEDGQDETAEKWSVEEYIRHHYRYGDLEFGPLADALSPFSRQAALPGAERLLGEAGTDSAPKDRKMKDAVELCRNWDEFFELNVLALWQYFPASKWTGWSGNHLTAELTQLGFVPFYMDFSAQKNTTYNHLASLSRKVLRKQALLTETRNVVAAYMKRNDPVTRRFIQYALMRTNEFLILVRDGKNGRIVVAPGERHRWIRLAAQLQFNFMNYFEVYIWDFKPGEKPLDLYHHIHDSLLRALRVQGVRDKMKHVRYIMGSLTREQDTKRVRQIKPGEHAQSLYDELTGPNAEFYLRTNQGVVVRTKEDLPAEVSPYTFYNETDEAEDAILVEEESLKDVPEDMPFLERALNLERERENKDREKAGLNYEPGAEQFPFAVPPIWEQAHFVIRGLGHLADHCKAEPHRPGQLDLFIKYNNLHKYADGLPPSYIPYKDFPQLLPAARKFSADKPSARFALLRL